MIYPFIFDTTLSFFLFSLSFVSINYFILMFIEDDDNLISLPSDNSRDKLDLAEFYHKILWASQQFEEQLAMPIKKKGRKVTFSLEPPIVHEYEPELISNTNKTYAFNYQTIKRNLDQGKEKYYYCSTIPSDELCEQNVRLLKTRSISDFKPISNGLYHSNGNTEATSPNYNGFNTPNDCYNSDSSYIEYPNNLDETKVKNAGFFSGNLLIKKTAFFKRTLLKIKSSPKLIQRKSSMISLRKNSSFFTLGA